VSVRDHLRSLERLVIPWPLSLHILHQQASARAERELLRRQQLPEPQLQLGAALRNNNPALKQEGAQLVEQRRAFTDQSVAS